MTDVLETKDIRKSFAAVQALRGVDFRIRRGELHALVGHNGAGKSTLVKILNGVFPAGSFSGVIRLNEAEQRFTSPADARARGIAYVPQEIQVLEHLSVGENIFLGQTGLDRRGLVSFRQLNRRAAALLAELEVELDPRMSIASLSAAQRQIVMVARALASRPSVLMLDEPTASLSRQETERLFAVLRRLRARGVTMVFITHRIPEILELCDRATVLRDGRIVAELERAEFHEEAIVSAMVGRRLELLFPERSSAVGTEEVLRVEHLRIPAAGGLADIVEDASFNLRRGEVLGVAGLLGSGRTELLSAIYGRLGHEGRVLVGSKPTPRRRPSDARRAGIAMLTEDRKREGLLFNLPVRDNITIGNLGRVSRYGVIDRRAEGRAAISFMRALSVRASSPGAEVAHLSGGNQQKLLFARVLMNAPRILLLDEPTKGVDVETRQEIYRLVVELADQGVAILLVSSEIPELLGLCDRCIVLAEGRIVDEFLREDGSEQRVVRVTATARRRAEREEAVGV